MLQAQRSVKSKSLSQGRSFALQRLPKSHVPCGEM